MSLRTRTLVILTATLSVALLVLTLVLQSILEDKFSALENRKAQDHVRRIELALDNLSSQLASKTTDWAQWDDTYNFMLDRNEDYLKSNISFETLSAIAVTYVVYRDTEGTLVRGYEVDYSQESVGDLSPQAMKTLGKGTETMPGTLPDATKSGLTMVGEKPYLFAAIPIFDSRRSEACRGSLLFAIALDDKLTETLAQQTRLDVHIIDPKKFAATNGSLYQSLLRSSDPIAVPTSGEQILGFKLLKDSNGTPIRLVQVTLVRDIFLHGQEATSLLITALLGVMAIALVVSGLCLNRWVLKRLSNLDNELRNIQPENLNGYRVSQSGNDELTSVATTINTFLTALENSQRQLITARDKAETANRAKSNFVAKVSHELRTPIHSVLGLVRVVRKNSTDEAIRSHLGMIRDSALGLLGVVNDILDFSRSEVGQLAVNVEPMQIRDTMRNAMRIIGPRIFERAETTPIECVASIDEAIPDTIIGDSKRISQILVNLMGNAIKFTTRGHIGLFVRLVTGADNSPRIEFTVEDTGSGIPADQLSLIFEPFKQVDDSVSRQYQGTGLGLTIVKQLVESMGGQIRVESTLGQGSRFIFDIPMNAASTVEHAANQAVRNANVWLINNSDLEAELIATAFKRYGATVTPMTTASLRSMNMDTLDLKGVNYLCVAGNALISHRSWTILKNFRQLVDADHVLISLSPHELTYREQLQALNISNLILTPLIAEESVRALTGHFKENFGGYDDFIDIAKTSKDSLEILIADDLLTNQIVLRCMLTDMGHRVTTVSNGRELVEALGAQLQMREKTAQDKTFDIVLTDVQMPVLDGVSAVKQIREREEQLDIPERERLPILLVTAHALVEEHHRILASGANGVVTKPIDAKDLEVTIDDSVKRRNNPKASAPIQSAPIEKVLSSVEGVLDALSSIELRVRNSTETEAVKGEALIDVSVLKSRVNQDTERLQMFLTSYDVTLQQLMAGLERAIGSTSTSDLETSAHSLKGCLGELGCRPGAGMATAIVELCRTSHLDQARENAQQLLPIVRLTHQVVKETIQAQTH